MDNQITADSPLSLRLREHLLHTFAGEVSTPLEKAAFPMMAAQFWFNGRSTKEALAENAMGYIRDAEANGFNVDDRHEELMMAMAQESLFFVMTQE